MRSIVAPSVVMENHLVFSSILGLDARDLVKKLTIFTHNINHTYGSTESSVDVNRV